MTPRILNSIGLIVGIIGVIIIFLWGPPQPQLDTGISIGLEDGNFIEKLGKTVGEYNKDVLKRRDFHTFMSGLGLICIMIGFAFQLVATWIPMKSTGQTLEPSAPKQLNIPESNGPRQPSDIKDSSKEIDDEAMP